MIAASQTGWHSWLSLLPLLRFDITSEPYVDLLAVIGVIGIFASLAKKRFFLPVWFLIIFIVSPRTAKTFAMIPFAMLIGIGIDQVILPGIQNLIKVKPSPTLSQNHQDVKVVIGEKGWGRIPKYLLAYFVFYAFLSAIFAPVHEHSPLEALSIEQKECDGMDQRKYAATWYFFGDHR